MSSIKRYGAIRDDVETPTITAGAYSLGDAVGGKLTFDLLRMQYTGGILSAVVLVDKAQQMVALNLWLFNQTFTAATDNAAFSPSDADLDNCIGVVEIAVAHYKNAVTNSVATVTPNLAIYSADADGNIYGQLQIPSGGAAPTYVTTSDLQLRLVAVPDVW